MLAESSKSLTNQSSHPYKQYVRYSHNKENIIHKGKANIVHTSIRPVLLSLILFYIILSDHEIAESFL